MVMVTTGRARLVALCALLSLPPLGGALADPAIKPAITGLIATAGSDQKNTLDPLNAFQGIFGGYVVRTTWKELQRTGASDFDTTVIDGALDKVRQYNDGVAAAMLPPPNNRQIGVRLRVWAGCDDTPEWATKLDGGPITITAHYGRAFETCKFGRFWDTTSDYAAAWRQLQAMLANKYDNLPLVHEVAVTSCTSFSAEPFFLPWQHQGDTTKTALLGAHFTDGDYQQCLQSAVADYAPWQKTRLEYTFNPFYGLNTQDDVAFSEQVMRGCRQAAGQRCILSNHDLAAHPPTASAILPLYAAMRRLGPNITFQAYVAAPNDYEGTIRKGVSLGAGSIEVWQERKAGSFEHQTAATLESWASMFEPQ
jgi:hypothetical protein